MCCQESICNVNISNINSIPSEWKHYGCFHTVSSELFLKTLLASGTWYWSPFRVHSPICHPSFFMSMLLGFHLFNNSTKIFEASYVQQHGSPGNRSAETQNAAQKGHSPEGTQMRSKGCGERNRTHAQETVQGRWGGQRQGGRGGPGPRLQQVRGTGRPAGPRGWTQLISQEARAEIKVSFHLPLYLLQGSHMVTLVGVF